MSPGRAPRVQPGWGEQGPLPAGGVVVRSDAEARAVVDAARREGTPIPPIGLLGGDLCRTLGGRGDEERLRSVRAARFPVDLGVALVDGRRHYFVAHLVARRSWWRGPLLAAMNAEYLGPWDVAPRAHPGDGVLDVLQVDPAMGLGQRWAARSRLARAAHLPHPQISVRQLAELQAELAPPMAVWCDGERVAPDARALSIRLEPAALLCVL